ncbi:MAG: ABC transporter ATP-binding protein [Chloroflexi bacterium]|nr:ABC transporter ATP-binding protein [Chloroflexota bacterium]
MDALIHAENLTKRFERHTAVANLNLQVHQGEVLAFLGPNGAGKTTTVRMLTSILRPTTGRASVAGYDVVRDARRVRAMVGHLTEFPGLYLRMNARDYLDFYGELYGMARPHRRARTDELLAQFGIADAGHRRLSEFSKGMRQKVALIRAMLNSPRVLFLDEPTSAMDPHSAKQVRDAVAQLRGRGHTVFLCTHNLFEAESLADRIAMIRRGALIALGTTQELKTRFLGAPLIEIQLAKRLEQPWSAFVEDGHVQEFGERYLRYRTETPQSTNPRLIHKLNAAGAEIVTVSETPQSLEQVYLKLVEEA